MIKNLLTSPTKIRNLEKELGLNNIDLNIHKKFIDIICKNYSQRDVKEYLYKLHTFCLLVNKNLNAINLYNEEHSLFFSNLIFFLENNGFSICAEDNQTSIRMTRFLISELNLELVKKISLEITPNLTIKSINYKALKYLSGWFYEHKTLKGKSFINLYKYSELFGLDEANKIEKIIKSIQNFRTEITIFNSFISYLVDNKQSIFNSLDKVLLHDFMKLFFNEIVENNKCLNSAKRVWNIFVRTLKEYFNLDNNIKLNLTREHKNPNEMNLKNINGNLVKKKLITHIPLEITDDKSLYLIKDKINQDLDLIKDWAISNLKNFDEIKSDKFVGRKELYSIFVLLTLNQPAITESFLYSLKNKNCYVKIENKHILVGKKSRKGHSLAEQKIIVNDFCANILNKYIEWTKHYERVADSFFVYKGKEGVKCFDKDTGLYHGGVKKNLMDFLKKQNISEEYIKNLAENAYLSKIRASVAIQIYFETENTTKMAEALGHTTYNPKLLSHYLPQSILDFYQQRWIRIFQKGLICEALKNNSLLFKASNFENMEQLDTFLKNHILKNIPDNLSSLEIIDNQHKKSFDNIYISINEENLTALFSLKKAIEESKEKEKICEKAFFWFNFSEKIENEILNKREYNELRLLLTKSKEQASGKQFNQVIYE